MFSASLEKWFKNNAKAKKLLHAPILVSTIDHLTPATEGVRGGRQIVPMLRLLTSDLVLDEPDEFDLNDLSVLTRLVNWAGMLGAKVLVSTATMPPALAYALFEAYQDGRKAFNAATKNLETPKPVICAWFDEYGAQSTEPPDIQGFAKVHDEFIQKRITKLNRNKVALRKAKLLEIFGDESPLEAMSRVIRQGMLELHQKNCQQHITGKRVSIGLVRMANIKPLVALGRLLYEITAPKDCRIHYCVYHSQYPLAQRAFIESKLDQSLDRKDSNSIWKQPEIQYAVQNYSEENHLFVVLATSVAEVGRDHDYDWAIAEPSSMRSIIQIAGRIQRHRKQVPKTENFYILAKNYKALKNNDDDKVAYLNPGFEADNRKLVRHDLHDILDETQFSEPNAIPSIQRPKQWKVKPPFSNLVTLEQIAYRQKLFEHADDNGPASLWWKQPVSWCAEIQRRQAFRASIPDQAYCLYLDEEGAVPVWKIKNDNVCPPEYEEISNITGLNFVMAHGNQPWFDFDIEEQYGELAEKLEKPLKYVSHCFGEIRLPDYGEQAVTWRYSRWLGVFREI